MYDSKKLEIRWKIEKKVKTLNKERYGLDNLLRLEAPVYLAVVAVGGTPIFASAFNLLLIGPNGLDMNWLIVAALSVIWLLIWGVLWNGIKTEMGREGGIERVFRTMNCRIGEIKSEIKCLNDELRRVG